MGRRCCTPRYIVIFVLISAWMLSVVLLLSRHPYDNGDETALRRERAELKSLKTRLHELSGRVQEFENFMEEFVPPPTYPPPSHQKHNNNIARKREMRHDDELPKSKTVPTQRQQVPTSSTSKSTYSWTTEMKNVLKCY